MTMAGAMGVTRFKLIFLVEGHEPDAARSIFPGVVQ
jgi:hypothetical protein